MLFLLIFLFRRKKNKFFSLGFILAYAVFLVLVYFNHQLSLEKIDEVRKQSVALEMQMNDEKNDHEKQDPVKDTKETSKNTSGNSINISEHTVFQGKRGQKLIINLTITNNTAQDFNNFKIIYRNNDFQKTLVLKAIKPTGQSTNNSFEFGKLASGTTHTFTFEGVPTKAGTFETPVSFQNNDQLLLDNNGNAITDTIKVLVTP